MTRPMAPTCREQGCEKPCEKTRTSYYPVCAKHRKRAARAKPPKADRTLAAHNKKLARARDRLAALTELDTRANGELSPDDRRRLRELMRAGERSVEALEADYPKPTSCTCGTNLLWEEEDDGLHCSGCGRDVKQSQGKVKGQSYVRMKMVGAGERRPKKPRTVKVVG